ncbi:hypothetical protein FACS1894153_4050 [Bacteroidia bacterium]|nr:hypothetical protein FACS1894153_4050 [Bacteroidia bacterium]
MKEEFLHYLWRFSLWTSPLFTEDDELIEIINVGRYNKDAGPDFFSATLRIGSTLWAGHIEIHIKATEWHEHHHHEDATYNNVILHIVYENDGVVTTKNGFPIKTCCIKNKFDISLLNQYTTWNKDSTNIACSNYIKNIRNITVHNMIDKICIEHLENLVDEIMIDLSYNNRSWEDTFYQYLLKNFGLKINTDGFYYIAKCTPLKILQKHQNNIFQLEAILFGQAKLLTNSYQDSYILSLYEEYHFLKSKYKLIDIQQGSIKFLRLRPVSFPTIRLALFARFINKNSNFFENFILHKHDLHSLYNFFDLETSGYWDEHYIFGKQSKNITKTLGISTINSIIINTIIPFMFAFGKLRGINEMCDNAIKLLYSIDPEDNSIIRKWSELGIKSDSAFDTQGLILLKNKYCAKSRCLECSIGHDVLSEEK